MFKLNLYRCFVGQLSKITSAGLWAILNAYRGYSRRLAHKPSPKKQLEHLQRLLLEDDLWANIQEITFAGVYERGQVIGRRGK